MNNRLLYETIYSVYRPEKNLNSCKTLDTPLETSHEYGVILTKFWSLATSEVVKTKSSGAASDENFVRMTHLRFRV